MVKQYTDIEYTQKAIEANNSGKKLYILKSVQNIGTETQEIEELIIAPENYYICYHDNYTDGTLNSGYETEKEQAEKERIKMLSLTKREVFLALYRAKGLTPDMVRNQITDTEALIEFDYATEYYRGNPLIDTIGSMLGYTSEDIDYLFINKELPEDE